MPPPLDARQILADRARTVDQVKRLYAVVMGYSLTSCLSNIYGCAKIIGFGQVEGIAALLGQGFTFVSLIVLFYLGAERVLDVRYLRSDSPVPSPRGLLLDLLTVGLTAGWFVILADTFPIPPSGPDPGFTAQILDGQVAFLHNIMVLYALDVVLLMLQLQRLLREPVDAERMLARKAHAFWILLNLGCLWLLSLALDWSGTTVDLGTLPLLGSTSLNVLTLAMVGLHAVRFLLDFTQTFQFYYPTTPLPPP